MRILIAYSTRYPRIRGGVDTMIVSLVEQLRQHHDVMLFAAGKPEEHSLTRSEEDGIATYAMHLRLPYYKKFGLRNFLAWMFEFPRSVARLRGLVRANRIDVIHLHMLNRYYLVFLVLRLLGGPPYVVTLHGSDLFRYSQQGPTTRLIARALLRKAAMVNAVSDSLAQRARSTFPFLRQVGAVANGVDLNDVRLFPRHELEARLEKKLPAQYFTVIGSLISFKAQDVAIAAWAELAHELPELHLFIVGDGGLAESYRQAVRASGCADRIHLTGRLPRDISLSLAQHGLGLIVPSRAEGFGYVLLEAGAIGLPVICSDIPPFLDIVESEHRALTFPVDDSTALASAVQRLTASPELRERLGASLQERVETTYSARRMAALYEDLYERASAA